MLRTALISVAALAVALPAMAADKYVPNIIAQPAAAKTKEQVWTGAYIEAAAGIASQNVEVDAFDLNLGDTAFSSHFGLGFDKLFNDRWLIGGFGRIQRDAVSIDAFGAEADVDYSYNLGVRFGIVPRNDVLFYGLVGHQWDKLDLSAGGDSMDLKRNGWMFGGGIEAALTNHIFLGVEASTVVYSDESVEDIEIDSDNWRSVATLKYKF